MLDQIIIRKKSVATLDPNVDFENEIYDLSTDTVYYSNAAIQTVVSSNAINGKARLQSRHLKQFVEHHIGISISFHVNHNAQSLAVALVVHV